MTEAQAVLQPARRPADARLVITCVAGEVVEGHYALVPMRNV
jgi:hypothetical protein